MNPPSPIHVAARARAFLEPRWRAWKAERMPWSLREDGIVISYSMCRFSALFLARVLERELGGEWIVDGGCGEPPGRADPRDVDLERAPGGMADVEGRWHGHYWVVDDTWTVIVDVTADQFGWDPVMAVASDDPRYRSNYVEAAIEGHLGHVSARVGDWLDEWSAASRCDPPTIPGM